MFRTRIISLLMVLSLLFCYWNSTVYADLSDENYDSYYEEISIDEDGVDIYIVQDGDEYKVVTKEQRDSLRSTTIDVGTFHVGIVRDSQTTAHLYWTATGTQLTYVAGRIFCKKTSLYVPQTYYADYIDTYYDLNGQYNSAYGSTPSFSVPSDTISVRVGWKNVTIATVQGGTIALPNAASTVSI